MVNNKIKDWQHKHNFNIESDEKSNIADIHILRVAQDKIACLISIVSINPDSIGEYKNKLKDLDKIAHLTIEINTKI